MASDPQEIAKQAYIAYVTEKSFAPKNATHLVNFSKFHNPPFVGVKYSIAKKVISNPPDVTDVNKAETKSSNPYLDPSITDKFMTADDNKTFIQKHNEIPKKSDIATAYDSYKDTIGQEPNDVMQFVQFCEQNAFKYTYSECEQYIQHRKPSKTPSDDTKQESEVNEGSNDEPVDEIKKIFKMINAKYAANKDIEYGSYDIYKKKQDQDDAKTVVVLCLNSEAILAGFAGDTVPQIAAPNHIIWVEPTSLHHGKIRKAIPIENGAIVDWDGIKRIFESILPKCDYVLITESIGNSKYDREKLTSLIFDFNYNVAGLYLAQRSVLAACTTSWNPTGFVVLSDYHCTEFVPVFEGYSMPHASTKINMGKQDVLKYLEENKNDLDDNYDGMDVLFNPGLCGKPYDGIHQLVYQSIMKCDIDIRGDMFKNIVLTGINTAYSGIEERLEKEIKALTSDAIQIKFDTTHSFREIGSWLAGSMLSSLSTFEEEWITREEYDESGASIVHRKCALYS